MHLSPTTLIRSAAGLAASAALVFVLAGCAPSAESDSTSGGANGAPISSDAEFSAARDAYDLKLAECLRGKGFDIKDPEPGKGIQESSDEINAAASICMSEVGDPPVREAAKNDTELHDAYLKLAACYRELGYDAPDPQVGEVFVIPDSATDEDIATCLDAGL